MFSTLSRRAAAVILGAAAGGGLLYGVYDGRMPRLGGEKSERARAVLADATPVASSVPISVPGVLGASAGDRLASRAGVVIDADSGRVITEQNAFLQLPLASLTKVMSTMVALDHDIDLDQEMTIRFDEYTIGGNLRIVPDSETVTVRDLLYASITGSANNAALALARSTGLSRDAFVQEMNRKAVELGFEHLVFTDPSGLSPGNLGTAYDIARLAAIAFEKYPIIRDAASQGEYAIVTRNTHREHVVKNPNTLFRSSRGVFSASKTGYLDEALYCLILARDTEQGRLIAVTLGHPSKEGGEAETVGLLDEAQRRLGESNAAL